MELSEARRRLEAAHAVCKHNCDLFTGPKRMVCEMIGAIDPVTLECDLTGIVPTLEREANMLFPRENRVPIQYEIARHAGRGGRGPAIVGTVRCGERLREIAVQQYLFHGLPVAGWEGLWAVWNSLSGRSGVPSSKRLLKWSLLLHYSGPSQMRVRKALWEKADKERVVDNIYKALLAIKAAGCLAEQEKAEAELCAVLDAIDTARYLKRRRPSDLPVSKRLKQDESDGVIAPEELAWMVEEYHRVCAEVKRQDHLLSTPLGEPIVFGPLQSGATATQLPDFPVEAIPAILSKVTKLRALCRSQKKQQLAAVYRASTTPPGEAAFEKAEALRRHWESVRSTLRPTEFPAVDLANPDQLACETGRIRGLILHRQKTLIAAVSTEAECVRRLVCVYRYGYLETEEVRCALRKEKKGYTATHVAKCGEKLLSLIHDPQSKVFTWQNGQLFIDYNSREMVELQEEYGAKMVELVVTKRQELEDHCRSGLYQTDTLWDTRKQVVLSVSDALEICLDKTDSLYRDIAACVP